MPPKMFNPNPIVYEKMERRPRTGHGDVDAKDIKDPEYPYTLEELRVITEDSIEVDEKRDYVRLPSRYKVNIRVAPGSHATEAAVNKQLNDKERVAAAMENSNLVDKIEEFLAPTSAKP